MIKIAILTPKNSYFFIENALKNLDLNIDYIFYDSLNSLANIYSEIAHKYDGVVTSGPIGFEIIKKNIKISTPIYYLEISKSDLYKYLFKVGKKYKNFDFSKVYIDFISEKDEKYWLEDIFEDNNKPILLPLSYSDEELYENFKKKYIFLKEKKKIKLVLTRISNMLPFLESINLKYDFLFPSENTIKDTIVSIFKDIKAKKYEQQSIIIGKIVGNNLEAISKFISKSFKNCIVQNYSTYIEIFCLKEDFFFSKLCELHSKNFDFFIGWGNAETLNQARLLAEFSLKEHINSSKKILNLISEASSIMLIKSSNADLLETSFIKKLSSLNIKNENIIRIINFLKNKENFDADEFSNYLNTTLRTTNRILEKLCKENIISFKLEKISRGRPKKIYFSIY